MKVAYSWVGKISAFTTFLVYWTFGGLLQVEINGMTGLVKFDAVDGFRSDVTLAVVELTKDGLNRIGR